MAEILGMGNGGNRSYFLFRKEGDFLSFLMKVFDTLGIEKTGLMHQMSEEDPLIMERKDYYEHTSGKGYDVDVFYGVEKVIVVFRNDYLDHRVLVEKIKALC
jgi:hypothetical protein